MRSRECISGRLTYEITCRTEDKRVSRRCLVRHRREIAREKERVGEEPGMKTLRRGKIERERVLSFATTI